MKIGFARVSTKWYQSEVQISELEKHGCDRVWKDSMAKDKDPQTAFTDFLETISEGDVVIATRLTSVANSSADLVQILEKIHKKGAFFKSVSEPWADTSKEGGAHIIETIRGMIDFEIAIADAENRIKENRPKTFGLSAGRPTKLSDAKKQEAIDLLRMKKSAAEVSRMLGVSRSTISRLKKDM